MFSTEDTIVAIATPPGRGGIGVIRISGPNAQGVAARIVTRRHPLKPRQATLTFARTAGGTTTASTGPAPAIDQVVATFFPEPSSYTGEHIVELSAHGSPVVLRAILQSAISAGARLAEPGEFTLRAFLNGRIDLPQAEAVADLIEAVTPLQARAAFDQLQGTVTAAIGEIERDLFDLIARLEASIDFPDEGYHFIEATGLEEDLGRMCARLSALLQRGRRGRLIREGRTVVIVGAPNVGKSSIFNALVGSARAIVTDVPGTTRDLVSETIDIDGLRVTLVDTAGIREARDIVEAEGISRSVRAAGMADVVVEVFDGTESVTRTHQPRVASGLQRTDNIVVSVTNKLDDERFRPVAGSTAVSAVTCEGLAQLRAQISSGVGQVDYVDCPEISNARHIALIERALASLESAREAVGRAEGALSEEFVLLDLQAGLSALEEVSGRRTSEDLLAHIFERFCVGK
jgi:tRNA modification GTPase